MPSRVSVLAFFAGMLLSFAASAWSAPVPISIQMLYEPTSLDPHKATTREDGLVDLDLFEGLTSYSATGTIIPGTAQSWEASADGLVWTFHLRPDAVWSDGMPLEAEDFVYSFRRALSPGIVVPTNVVPVPILNAAEIIAGREKDPTKLGVTALDAHTLRVTLIKPMPFLPAALTDTTWMPVPRQAIEAWADKWAEPGHMVSNGPFTLKARAPESEIDLARNPRFHDAGSVWIDEVRHVLADDNSAALKRYAAGELDVIRALAKGDLPRLKRDHPDELRSYPQLAAIGFLINSDSPVGRDPRIGRALSLVIDRDELESKVIRLDQIPAYGVVPPGMPDYTVQRPDWAGLPMAERVAMAKNLLAESGVPTPLKIRVLVPKIDLFHLYAQAVFAMWHSALGVETEEEGGEPRVLIDQLIHHDFEVSIGQLGATVPDAWSVLSLFQSEEDNPGNYRNPEFDSLLDRSSRMASPAERRSLLQSAEKRLLDDQAVIPLSYVVSQMLVSPRVRGIEDSALGFHPSRFLSVSQEK
ncbi:MAG TPA: peptide ABC transporter substrate-binding protein [Aliidongia sp.]|nr:peptide ABC transporter substrate-binding protein [Aliidongia sp.]